ncbi:hypothetical protein [Candidatus Protochlamydia phocaeensis]|uniref:hypothetical protein n=1 Tax=Candidatus Protochlamydia phocaeensis TaxID=1414722 RepID=UPI000837D539|nr:hypothetical protein [Candidatus Protochlamydia phocaeensis]
MSAINVSQILYGNPRFFIQSLETPPTIKNLFIKFTPNTLLNGGLATGIAFIASNHLPVALITGGVVALITLVASAILHIQLIRQPYDASLLERIPDPKTEPNEFKTFIHLLATNFHFAEAAKRKFRGMRRESPNSYGLDLITWAPQLEALRLAQELNDVELKTSCEKFLGERVLEIDNSFIKSHAIAQCFEAPLWQEKILQGTLSAYSGYNRELANFLEEHKESIKTFHLNMLSSNRSLSLFSAIIEKAPHLTSFTFTISPSQVNTWSMNINLPLLGELSKLRHLRILGGAAVDDLILSSFLNLRDLEELDIDCSRLTPEGINLLTHFPNLKRLTLRGGSHLPLESFEKLGQLSQLEHLELTNFVIGNEQLQRLTALSQLKSLAFYCDQSFYNEHINEFNYTRLSLFPQLEKLAVVPFFATEETIAVLSQLTRLKSLMLTIRNPNHSQIVSLFRNFSQLEELNLADSYLNHATEPFLASRNLKVLDLTNTRINVSLLDAQNFPQLEILKAKDADTGNGIFNLNGFSHLKTLDLSRSNLTDDQISTLVQLPKLEELDLSLNEDLSEQTIEHVAKHFKNLKEFYWTMKSYKGTWSLQSLDKLQKLEKIGLRNFEVPTHYATSSNRIKRLICSVR